MWLKGTLFVIFALFIDLLQAGISLSIAGMLVSINVIPVVGQFLSAGGAPVGFLLGIAINSTISLTAGVGHTAGMLTNFSTTSHRLRTRVEAIILRRVLIALFGEIIPIINNLPIWTISTLLTLRAIRKEEKRAQLKQAKEGGTSTNQPYAQAA